MFSVYGNGYGVYEWSKKEKKTENGSTLNKQVSPGASCKYIRILIKRNLKVHTKVVKELYFMVFTNEVFFFLIGTSYTKIAKLRKDFLFVTYENSENYKVKQEEDIMPKILLLGH